MHFITPRLQKDFAIAEFGSGFSTIWWANRVASVYSIEHNQEWADKINGEFKRNNCNNALVEFKTLQEYAKGLSSSSKKYDLILVDGIERNDCLRESVSHLTDRGVIVLDNSELKDYESGKAYLVQNGFKSIDFFGNAPIVAHFTTTTLYYRSNSCLGV
jgi:predicted O-methyltransferase YrrM